MIVFVIEHCGLFLKEVEDYQVLSWAENACDAMKFNQDGLMYASQLADTFGGTIHPYDTRIKQLVD